MITVYCAQYSSGACPRCRVDTWRALLLPQGQGEGQLEERRHFVRFVESVIFSQVARSGGRKRHSRQRE